MSLALHPPKHIVVSGSDDHLWKMWALPDGNVIMTGEGHTDWLSGCCFHPSSKSAPCNSGSQLVTSSGDTTVRPWDLSNHGCTLTLGGHAHAIWDCSWHSCGDLVASASMDSTSEIWDVNSERCRYTMCGHKDSVNSIEFLPFSNTFLTSSADKTLSLWDARMGDTIASCDSSGVMKLWDIWKFVPILSIDAGLHPAIQVIFDCSGHIMALASSNGSVQVLQLESGQLSSLWGQGSEVHSVLFHPKAEWVLSGDAGSTVCLWTRGAAACVTQP